MLINEKLKNSDNIRPSEGKGGRGGHSSEGYKATRKTKDVMMKIGKKN